MKMFIRESELYSKINILIFGVKNHFELKEKYYYYKKNICLEEIDS